MVERDGKDRDDPTRPARGPTRRQLLTGTGGLVAGGLVAKGTGVAEADTARGNTPPPLRFLTDAEAATVTAMAERVFPADRTSAGAREAGVASYIDGRLATGWGYGERMYLQGPFEAPQDSGHGYQLPLAPRDLYRLALARIDAHCRRTYANTAFVDLTAAQQDEVLTGLEHGTVDLGLGGFSSASFFAMFLRNVTEGLFCDPMHGGNRDMIGWKWVGFPGDPTAYGEPYARHIGEWDEPYDVPPKGVQ